MNEGVLKKLKEAIQASANAYCQLVLLVGPPGSGKTMLLRKIAQEASVPLVNVGFELSRVLLELTKTQGSLRLPGLFGQIVSAAREPAILDNLEILFDRSLGQDPLRLLLGESRNHRLLAAWSGEFSGGRLTYAAVGHPEYRHYDSIDALVVTMGAFSTLDPEND